MNASAKSAVSSVLPSISAQRKRKAQPSRQRDVRGDRYTTSGAYQPSAGLAQMLKPQRTQIETRTVLDDEGRPKLDVKGRPSELVMRTKGPEATVAVADPFEPGKRIQATVNRRVDLLEHERANNRITVSQYETGRQIQAVFERAAGARNTRDIDFGDVRISDPSKRQDLADLDAIRAIDNAHEVQAMLRRIHLAIGETPAHFVRELLSRGGTVKDYVNDRDQLASERKISQVADRFRYLLEVIDESFAARGAVVKDAEGNAEIRAERGEATGEETDERGRTVRAGRGYRWGRAAD